MIYTSIQHIVSSGASHVIISLLKNISKYTHTHLHYKTCTFQTKKRKEKSILIISLSHV